MSSRSPSWSLMGVPVASETLLRAVSRQEGEKSLNLVATVTGCRYDTHCAVTSLGWRNCHVQHSRFERRSIYPRFLRGLLPVDPDVCTLHPGCCLLSLVGLLWR